VEVRTSPEIGQISPRIQPSPKDSGDFINVTISVKTENNEIPRDLVGDSTDGYHKRMAREPYCQDGWDVGAAEGVLTVENFCPRHWDTSILEMLMRVRLGLTLIRIEREIFPRDREVRGFWGSYGIARVGRVSA
jgi:hypothetical protein